MIRKQHQVGGLEHLAYRADIDGLRAVAVLGVLIFHAFPALLPGGFAGVDVFFVISGYLISALILQDIGRGGFSLRTFYARRIRRIFPSLLAMLVAVWCLGYWLLMPGELRALGQSMVHSAYFANNFLLYGQAGYFDTDAELKPLLHLWSLSVEEQFYIVWPWVLLLAIRARRHGKWLPSVLALSSALACMVVTERQPVAAFFLPQYRGWELLVGAIAAIHGGRLRDFLDRYWGAWSIWLAPMGLLLIFAAYFLFSGKQPYPGWRALLPVIGAFLVIIGKPDSIVAKRCLGWRPVTAIGLISYPLYLWHWPLFAFARILYGEPGSGLLLSLIALSFLLAWASYRFLETPVRHASNRPMRSAFVPVCGVLLLLISGGVGDWTRTANGFPGRVPGEAWQALGWSGERIRDQDCARQLQPAGSYCQWSRPGDATAVLLGDSHANHFFPGLSPIVAGAGGNLVQMEGPLHLTGDENWTNIEKVLRQASIETVFIAYHYGRLHQKDNPFNGAIEEIIARLEKAGKRVIFLIDNPEFDFDPRLCTERPSLARWLGAGGNPEKLCTESLGYMRRKRVNYEIWVGKLAEAHPAVGFIDLFSSLCDPNQCSALSGKALWYRDRHHLTVRGAEHAFLNFADKTLPFQRGR